jgi:hypothetical protein
LLERFFIGEPEGQNFTKTLAKIRTLFTQVPWDTLTLEEREKLNRLEKSLNRLGRHVFTIKEASVFSLFDSYSFADFQVGYKKLVEPLAPPCATKRALNNTTGTLCWLNSFLKYLSVCPLYDSFLVTSNCDEEKEELRVRLHRIVTALRLGWQQPVINALQQDLLAFLKIAPTFSSFLQGHQDSLEFARLLHTPQTVPAGERVSSATIFSAHRDNVMKPGFEHEESCRLEIASTEEATIDLQTGFSKEDLTENIKEYFIKKGGLWINAQAVDEGQVFTKQDILLHLPECFEVALKRGFEIEPGKISISKQYIELSSEGTVSFLQSAPSYQLINDQVFLKDTVITSSHTYKVIAAIERFGSDERRGHFVAHLRQEDGSISTHSDAHVKGARAESIWRTASLLTLKRITTQQLNSEGEK